MRNMLLALAGCIAIGSMHAADSSVVSVSYQGTLIGMAGSTEWTSAKLDEYGAGYRNVEGTDRSVVGIGVMIGRLGTSTSSIITTASVRYATVHAVATSDVLFLPIRIGGGYLDYAPTEYRVDMSYQTIACDAGIAYSLEGVVMGARSRVGYILDGTAVEALHMTDGSGYLFPFDTPPSEGRRSADGRSLITREEGVGVFQRLQIALGGNVGYFYDVGRLRFGFDATIMVGLTSLHTDYATSLSEIGATLSVGWKL